MMWQTGYFEGAAATALYGSRAANGVVMITPKVAGKKKELESSITAEFSGQRFCVCRNFKMSLVWDGTATIQGGEPFLGTSFRWFHAVVG
ncbi:hypothetical protein NXX05_24195 [Bacteroides thetaiotaomicron]|uniref:hypothetical protein n=1 Tax=Bacteroides thetaiotaomicron TaxID=818 RepID=UPI002165378A|nr:hypothetical protein [Bacteroides thetaiotaomicron]MCS2850462.1 hypothetical protein [Bacteroides thetaiotaomicron]